MLSLLHRIDPSRARRYIEPSCGNGAFVNALYQAGVPRKRIRAVEIDRKLPADVHQDFLKTTRDSLAIGKWKPETTVVIGNPPFGKNGKTARGFLNKAAEYADWVCFVVPRSMHDGRSCSSLDPRLELIYERPIMSDFETTKAKCQWQEWHRLPEGQKSERMPEGLVDNRGLYATVHVDDRYDLVIQRCGGSAGKVTKCNKTGQGKYYIRSQYPEVIRAFKTLKQHEEAHLTTHQLSLSERMLHEMLERSLLQNYIEQITK